MTSDITQPPPAVKTAAHPSNLFSKQEVPLQFLRRPPKPIPESQHTPENNFAAVLDDAAAKKIKRKRRFKNAGTNNS